MREGFEGNPASMLLFFRFCKLYKIDSYEGRVEVLRKLAARKKLKYHRDGDAILKNKNVLDLRRFKDE